MPDSLVLPPPLLQALADHALAEAPRECCGILLGQGRCVTEVLPVENAATSPERAYALPPHALADALLRRPGREVLGFYHSHPSHDAQPSSQDIAHWQYPDLAMVIVSLPQARVAAWQVRPGVVTPLEIAQSAAAPAAPALTSAGRAAVLFSAAIAIMLVIALSLALLPPAPPIP